jgi:hypothetical protein
MTLICSFAYRRPQFLFLELHYKSHFNIHNVSDASESIRRREVGIALHFQDIFQLTNSGNGIYPIGRQAMMQSAVESQRYHFIELYCLLQKFTSLKSYLEFAKSNSCVRLFGNLDIKTLGGAGFASQRTTGEDRHWDLSGFDGIALKIKHGDG